MARIPNLTLSIYAQPRPEKPKFKPLKTFKSLLKKQITKLKSKDNLFSRQKKHKKCYLLNLPPELRIMIFKLALRDNENKAKKTLEFPPLYHVLSQLGDVRIQQEITELYRHVVQKSFYELVGPKNKPRLELQDLKYAVIVENIRYLTIYIPLLRDGAILHPAWQTTSTNLLESATSPLWNLRSLQHVTINGIINSSTWNLPPLSDLLNRLAQNVSTLRTIKLCCLLDGMWLPRHTVYGAARMASNFIINSRSGLRWAREGKVLVPTERWEVLFWETELERFMFRRTKAIRFTWVYFLKEGRAQ